MQCSTYRASSRQARFDNKVSAAELTGWSAWSAPCTTNMHAALHLASLETAAAAGMARSEGGSIVEQLGRWPT